MIDETTDAEVRLSQLAALTESIGPRPDFTAQVMARIAAERASWLRLIPSLWHRVLPVAALLATITAAWAYKNAHDAQAQLAVTIDADDGAEIDAL
jgi:hypothetical protein